MDKELSLLCKSKSDEKFLNFKVLKTIGKEEEEVLAVESTQKLFQKNKRKSSLEKFIFKVRVWVLGEERGGEV